MQNDKPKQEKPQRKRVPYRSKKDGFTKAERVIENGGGVFAATKHKLIR